MQEARGVEEWRCKKHKNRDAINKNIGAAERRIVQVLKCKNQEKRRCGDVDLQICTRRVEVWKYNKQVVWKRKETRNKENVVQVLGREKQKQEDGRSGHKKRCEDAKKQNKKVEVGRCRNKKSGGAEMQETRSLDM